MTHFIRVFSICLFLSFLGTALAQNNPQVEVQIKSAGGIYNFNNYTSEEGLLGSVSEYIFQDSKGYVWVGTRSGLNKLDGHQIQTFTPNDGLVHNLCRGIEEDSKGRIWIATEKGVSCYDGFEFTNYTVNEGLSYNQTWVVLENIDGGMMVGTSHGVDIIRDGIVEDFIDFDTTQGQNACRMMEYDSNGNLWISTGLKLYKVAPDLSYEDVGLDGLTLDMAESENGDIWLAGWGMNLAKYSEGKLTPYHFKSPINSIQIDANGTLWLGSWDKGLLKFDGDSTAIQFSANEGLLMNTLWNVLVDAEGTVWTASYGAGVCQLVNERFSRYTEKSGLANDVVNEIVHDKKRNIVWVATEGGLSKMDGSGTIINFTEEEGLFNGKVQTVALDSNGVAWISIYGGNKGTYKVENNELSEGIIPGGFDIMFDSFGNFWKGGDGGGAWKYTDIEKDVKGESYTATDFNKWKVRVHEIFEDSQLNLWFGVDLNTWHIWDYKLDTIFAEIFPEHMKFETGVFIEEDHKGYYWLNLGSTGLYRCSYNAGQITIHDSIRVEHGLLADEIAGIMAEEDRLWVNTIKGLSILNLNKYYETGEYQFTNYSKQQGFVGEGFTTILRKSDDEVLIGTTKGMLVFHEKRDKKITSEPFTNIESVLLNHERVDWRAFTNDLKPNMNVPNSIELPYDQNHLTFSFIGISFSGSEYVKYQYQLEGFDEKWSPVTSQNEIIYSNISPGDYVFKVKSMNTDGVWDSTPDIIHIKITPPYWQTWWFRTILVFLGLILIVSIFRWRLRKLNKDKQKLENKVSERTKQLQVAYDQIEEKNHEITDSISYAKGIQEAILPPSSHFKELVGDSFVFYKPKDIVAGDFYWLNTWNNKVLFAAADCTGHGVPGAMVSVVCHGALNRSVREFDLHEPARILGKTREIVIETFSKSERDVKDGMDVSLCCLDKDKGTLEFSGANNSLYVIKNGEIEEIKADKQPVGKYEFAEDFTNHSIKVEDGMCIYLFSDGYADQFGGEKGKKLKYKPFKEILLKIHQLSMDEQKEILNKEFEKWKGDFEQVDDVCIIGVRL